MIDINEMTQEKAKVVSPPLHSSNFWRIDILKKYIAFKNCHIQRRFRYLARLFESKLSKTGNIPSSELFF